MKRFLCSVITVALIGLAARTPLGAQEPRDFCAPANCPPGQDCCSEDLLEVKFANGSSTLEQESGDFTATVAIDVKSDGIQGFSYAIKHDKSILTINGTSTDNSNALIRNANFNVHAKAFGCTNNRVDCPQRERTDPDRGLGHAVVLSFTMPVVLPVQDDIVLLTATYTVSGNLPEEGTKIEWADGELATASGGPDVSLNLTVAGETRVPNQVTDGLVVGGPPPPECAEYGFYFGDAATTDNLAIGAAETGFLVSMRNVKNAAAFELAVKNDSNSLSFVSGEIGDGPDNLRELIITDEDGLSNTPSETNTASIAGDNMIGSGERVGVTVDTGVQDFFVVQTQPLVGEGFFAGYVADLTAAQNKVIPATGAGDPCPINQIIRINFGVAETPFNRGDVNGDDRHNVTDAVIIVKDLFGRPNPGIDCASAYDTNNDDAVDISDATFLLEWIFRRGPRPPDPFRQCAVEENDALDCATSNCR